MASAYTPNAVTRRRTAFVYILLAIFLSLTFQVFAAEQATVPIHIIQKGAAFIPLRSASEQLGSQVTWMTEEQKAVIQRGKLTTEYELSDEQVILLDGVAYVELEHYTAQEHLSFITQPGQQALLYRIGEANAERMMISFRSIAAEPHPAQSENQVALRNFLANSLEELGYEVELQAVPPAMAYMPMMTEMYATNPEPAGYNLIAKRNSNPNAAILILGTGYDTMQGSPDAIIRGSGVVGLLEIAELVKDIPSSVELRFVFFDSETNGLGSLQYVRSLSANEIDRTMGMLELDVIGSLADVEILAHTLDGNENFLTDVLNSFDRAEVSQGSIAPFYSANIPVVRVSGDIVETMNFITLENEKKDTLEIVDPAKLKNTVNQVADAIGFLLSDAAASYRSRNMEIIDINQVGNALSLDQRFAFSEMTKDNIQEMINVPLIRVPIMPTWGKTAYLSYAAYVDWLGMPLMTLFQFTLPSNTLSDIRVVVSDAKELISLFDAEFSRIDNLENYSFLQITNIPSECLGWRDENGNAYVLGQDANEFTFWLTSYHKEVASLTMDEINAEASNLTTLELSAWHKVEKLLLATGINNQIQSVVFVDDGKNGVIINITPAPLTPDTVDQDFIVTIDANDLTASVEEQMDRNALQSFLASLALSLPETYLQSYIDNFGKQWVEAYIKQEHAKDNYSTENTVRELEAQIIADPIRMAPYMRQDLAEAFIYYTCGTYPNASASILAQPFTSIYGDDYDKNIKDFFSQISDLTPLMEYIADLP